MCPSREEVFGGAAADGSVAYLEYNIAALGTTVDFAAAGSAAANREYLSARERCTAQAAAIHGVLPAFEDMTDQIGCLIAALTRAASATRGWGQGSGTRTPARARRTAGTNCPTAAGSRRSPRRADLPDDDDAPCSSGSPGRVSARPEALLQLARSASPERSRIPRGSGYEQRQQSVARRAHARQVRASTPSRHQPDLDRQRLLHARPAEPLAQLGRRRRHAVLRGLQRADDLRSGHEQQRLHRQRYGGHSGELRGTRRNGPPEHGDDLRQWSRRAGVRLRGARGRNPQRRSRRLLDDCRCNHDFNNTTGACN